MGLNLAGLPGDGAGPSVTTQALNVVQAMAERFEQSVNFNEGLIGGVAIDTLGRPLSHETLCVIVGCAKMEVDKRIMSDMLRPNRRGETWGMC